MQGEIRQFISLHLTLREKLLREGKGEVVL